MGYSFSTSDRNIQAALRRIACEQIDEAHAKIADPNLPRDKKLHELRKHAKKLRGLVRLVRPVFADFKAEDSIIRDAARTMSGLRDSDVMLATFDKIAATQDGPSFAPLRNLLPHSDHANAAGRADQVIADYDQTLAALHGRARHWALSAKGFDALAPGLATIWTEGRRALSALGDAPGDDQLHDWRKRVKYHWYHARLLAPIWPDAMAEHSRAANDLGEILGDHHDLGVLRHYLAAAETDMPDLRRAFVNRITQRQDDLLLRTRALGGRLYADPAKALIHRWGVWWDLWQAEG